MIATERTTCRDCGIPLGAVASHPNTGQCHPCWERERLPAATGLPVFAPEPTRCKGWGHRSCMGHYSQPQPGEIVHLAGPNYTRVSAEPGWFGMGYVRNDGRLTEIITESGEAFVVTGYHDGTGQIGSGEWQAVVLA